jgi:hypothetical protein
MRIPSNMHGKRLENIAGKVQFAKMQKETLSSRIAHLPPTPFGAAVNALNSPIMHSDVDVWFET